MEERTRPGRVLELGAGRLVEVELAPLVLAWEAEFRAAAPVGGACEKRVGRCESVGTVPAVAGLGSCAARGRGWGWEGRGGSGADRGQSGKS